MCNTVLCYFFHYELFESLFNNQYFHCNFFKELKGAFISYRPQGRQVSRDSIVYTHTYQ